MHLHKTSFKRPFLKWAGSKTKLLPDLVPLLPKAMTRLVEPFAGSGAVFLNADCQESLLADSNEALTSLYAGLKESGQSLVNRCKRLFTARNNSADRFYKLREEFN